MDIQEVRLIGIAIAANYAACEEEIELIKEER